MGRKEGGYCAPFAESCDSVYYNVAWAEVYFRTKWRLHPSSHNRHKPKTAGCPLSGGAATLSNTTSPEPTFTSVPSGILIHQDVWPQKTWAENWRGLRPFWEGGLSLHLPQSRLG